MVVRWLRLPSNAVDTGLIPGQRTKIPHGTKQLRLHSATTEPTRLNKDPAQPKTLSEKLKK